MQFYLYSPISIKPWSPSDLESGIGGIETALAEMAWRLAAKGHKVTIYADVKEEIWKGVEWKNFRDVDFKQEGIWVIYRSEDDVRRVNLDSQVWFMCQDWNSSWKPDNVERMDRIMVLCNAHKQYLLQEHPELEAQMTVTSHGVKLELVHQMEFALRGTDRARNPKRIMYASSPDRGLMPLLKIFSRTREVVPDLELHIFYGFDGIDELTKDGKWPAMAKLSKELKAKIKTTKGVVMHNRVTQAELYEQWFQSGLMVYPTMFAELTFIAGQEAQCCGAIPIVSNAWAQAENAGHGLRIHGDPTTPLVQAQFAAEIARLASNPDLQESIRKKMVKEARERCGWEKIVDQWVKLAKKGPDVKKIHRCRVCRSENLRPVLDIGTQAVATVFPKAKGKVLKAPLKVVECGACFLGQLSHTVNREDLFRDEYGYRSGLNESMARHLIEVAEGVPIGPKAIVVDIGCNDGTLLNQIDARCIGFDPNASCPQTTHPRKIYIRDFFSAGRYMAEMSGELADVVFTLAMFYDLEDPVLFSDQIRAILKPGGVWVIEVQDADQLISKGAYDFICHEHVTNWNFIHLAYFLSTHGFTPQLINRNPTNGGSILVHAVKANAAHAKDWPHRLKWDELGRKMVESKKKLLELLDSLKPAKVWGYGASTKGNVLLQYCELTSEHLQAIAERNPDKCDRITPGSEIRIVSEEVMRQMKPDYLLALPWGFIDSFRKREPWAKFIVPFPEPKVLPALDEETGNGHANS